MYFHYIYLTDHFDINVTQGLLNLAIDIGSVSGLIYSRYLIVTPQM